MTSDAEFIAEIAKSPSDDAPRLAYAQWLESMGNPRGEFIRLQCEIARREWRNPIDPFPINPKLYQRESQLLRLYAEEWLDDFGPLPLDKDAFAFHRGMLDEVECDIDFFVHSGRELLIPSLPTLRRLSLLRREEEISEGLNAASHLKRFTWLNLEKCPLGSVRVVELLSSSVVSNIRSMRLGFEHYTDKQWLRDEEWILGSDVFLAICSSPHLAQLIELRCPTMDLVASDLEKLPRASHWVNLEVLDLSDCEIDADGLKSLLSSSQPPVHLRYLDIEGNPAVGDQGSAALAGSLQANSVELLNLANTNMGLEGLRQLCSSSSIGNLAFLYLDGNGIDERGFDVLAQTDALANLKILQLKRTAPHALGLTTLVSSVVFNETNKLNLDSCAISDAEIVAMLASFRLPKLRHLSLRGNGISDVGAIALASSPALAELATLDLSNNPISERGVESLIDSDALRRVQWIGLHPDRYSEHLRSRIRDRFSY